jgi:hypothetical protein
MAAVAGRAGRREALPRRWRHERAAGVTRSPLLGFIARVFAWLPAAFVVWYFAAPVLMWPVALLVELVARPAFGDLVRDVEQAGSVLVFATALKPGSTLTRGAEITVDVNMLLYSFGLPLYAALVLAAREPGWARRLLAGYAALIPFVAWGVLADFLQAIAITSGPQIASQTGFVAWQREAIVFFYQFGTLILPTVVPAVLWVLTHRGFLERLRTGPGD